jgi:Protein of unknown function (DUF3048) N-terminal domain/Protein of unknown function (DUF3048) C-terminal domain
MIPTAPRPSTRARRLSAALLAAGLVALAACSGGDDAASTTVPETTEAPATTEAATTVPETTEATTTTVPPTTEAPTTTAAPEVPRMPLTGAPLAPGETVPDRPALAVKVDNVECAHRTQQGLNQADIVFEEIVEGRLTRFAAIFHSQSANPVGPIRSGRSQDVDLLGAFQRPLMAWSGGNPGVVNFINGSDLINLSYQNHAGGYYRAGNCATPHNLWNNTDTLWEQAPPEAGRPNAIFQYVDPGAAVPGAPATSMTANVGVNSVRWDWDAASGTYLRTENGRPHTLADGSQVSTNNVVMLVLEYRVTPWEAKSPEGVTVGSGQVFVFSNGTVQTGTWTRADRTAPYTLTADDGTPIKMAPGRTFVELGDVVDQGTAWG